MHVPISLLSFALLFVFEVEAIKTEPLCYAATLRFHGLTVEKADQQYSSGEQQALSQPQEFEPAQTQRLSQAEPAADAEPAANEPAANRGSKQPQSRRCQQQLDVSDISPPFVW